MKKRAVIFSAIVIVLLIAGIVLANRASSQYAKDFRSGVFIAQEKAQRLNEEERELALRRLQGAQEQKTAYGALEAYLREAGAYADLGENRRARDVLKEAEKVFAKEAELYEAKGELLARMRQYKDAAKAYEKAIALAPTDYRAYLSLVELYQNHSNVPEKAELIFERAVAGSAAGREILINYASFLEVQKKDYAKALGIWTQAVEKARSESERQAIMSKIKELRQKLGLPPEP